MAAASICVVRWSLEAMRMIGHCCFVDKLCAGKYLHARIQSVETATINIVHITR